MRKEKQMNGIHTQSIVRQRLLLAYFLRPNTYMSAYHHFLFVFLFLVPMCVYRATKHQLRRYIVLYIDGKNAYDSVCRIILKSYKRVSAQ